MYGPCQLEFPDSNDGYTLGDGDHVDKIDLTFNLEVSPPQWETSSYEYNFNSEKRSYDYAPDESNDFCMSDGLSWKQSEDDRSVTVMCSEFFCGVGYIDDDGICKDIDECSLGTHGCNENADCANNDGGYTCECKPGYHGDGRTCNVLSPGEIAGIVIGTSVFITLVIVLSLYGLGICCCIFHYIFCCCCCK